MSEAGNMTNAPPTGINPTPQSIVAAVFVAILILVTLFGNALVCISFYSFPNLRTICNYFIVSLSVADILVALLAMPFWLIVQLNNTMWPFSKDFLLFWACIDIFLWHCLHNESYSSQCGPNAGNRDTLQVSKTSDFQAGLGCYSFDLVVFYCHRLFETGQLAWPQLSAFCVHCQLLSTLVTCNPNVRCNLYRCKDPSAENRDCWRKRTCQRDEGSQDHLSCHWRFRYLLASILRDSCGPCERPEIHISHRGLQHVQVDGILKFLFESHHIHVHEPHIQTGIQATF
ncbi:hypothetical protein ACROYT_G005819 [Oculina patagonica]